MSLIFKTFEYFILFELFFYGWLLLIAHFILANWKNSKHLVHLLFALAWRKRQRIKLYQQALCRHQSANVSRKMTKQFIKNWHLNHTMKAFEYYVYLMTLYPNTSAMSRMQLIDQAVQMQLANDKYK